MPVPSLGDKRKVGVLYWIRTFATWDAKPALPL